MPSDADVRRLTLSCLLLGFVGPTPPPWLLEALADGLGGVVLFGSNLGDGREVSTLTSLLRKAAGRELVIALDEEGGDVTRLDTFRGSASPGAAALGYLDDLEATEDVYAAIGSRLVEAGVTVNLAPVADVNVDPHNPVIGVRAFGADAALVSRHVAAAVRGLQRTGVAACAKHFPGHGATSADSHHEVATLTRSRREIEDVELPPFAAAIAAGTRAVMTGHLVAPALDPANLATVSRAVTTELLRSRLGFDGTVMTDALEMRALAGTLGMERGFVAALRAGADVIETGALDYPYLLQAIPQAVLAAIESGELPFDRLEDASRRTAALATPGKLVEPPAVAGVAARCIEVVGELPTLTRPLVVEARPPGGMASGELPWSFADELAARVPGSGRLLVAEATTRLPDLRGRTLVLVVRDPHRHTWQRSLIEVARAHPSAVIVDVGWPAELPADVASVRTRGVAPGLLEAAADRIAGRMAS